MQNNVLYGISLMIITTFMFSSMDGFSRYLAENNNVFTLVTMRYWFIAIIMIIACLFIKNPISKILKTKQPYIHNLESNYPLGMFKSVGLYCYDSVFFVSDIIKPSKLNNNTSLGLEGFIRNPEIDPAESKSDVEKDTCENSTKIHPWASRASYGTRRG